MRLAGLTDRTTKQRKQVQKSFTESIFIRSCSSSREPNVKDKNKIYSLRNKIPLDWWKEFVGELFEDSGCQDPPVIADCSVPFITKDEVEAEIGQNRGGKHLGRIS